MKRIFGRLALALVAIVLIIGAFVAYDHRKLPGHPSELTPADTALQHPWFYFYPKRGSDSLRAFVVFFGNDVAFWEPHQELAWGFAGDGCVVVGIDLRKYLATLPDEPQRDSAFAVAMPDLIARSRHALGADNVPVVLAGHSFGAEIAIWIARHHPPPQLAGVLAMNTRSSGHLFITTDDWVLNKEATGPYSWSTIDAVRELPQSVRVGLVRGGHDRFMQHDSAFIAAGGEKLKRFEIPMAGHALTTLLLAGPVINRALDYVIGSKGR